MQKPAQEVNASYSSHSSQSSESLDSTKFTESFDSNELQETIENNKNQLDFDTAFKPYKLYMQFQISARDYEGTDDIDPKDFVLLSKERREELKRAFEECPI